jgi:hypothetical protein
MGSSAIGGSLVRIVPVTRHERNRTALMPVGVAPIRPKVDVVLATGWVAMKCLANTVGSFLAWVDCRGPSQRRLVGARPDYRLINWPPWIQQRAVSTPAPA